MKKIVLTSLTLVTLSMMLMVSSCKKAKQNKDTTSSEDNALAESMFDDMFNNVNQASDEKKVSGSYKTGGAEEIQYTFGDSCATVTISPEETEWPMDTFPKTIVIDFGTTNCTGKDGKERRGKINAVLSGKIRESGTTVTITPEDYYVNDHKIEGTKVVTNITQTGGNIKFSIDVDGTITTPEGETITWESSREREWIEGSNTSIIKYENGVWTWVGISAIYDDVWEVTGGGSGVASNGTPFTLSITTPLRVQWCSQKLEITEGVIELQPENLKLRTIDYGNQSCDNDATVTIGNNTYNISASGN